MSELTTIKVRVGPHTHALAMDVDAPRHLQNTILNVGPAGADGRPVEIQAGVTHIQWRYEGDVVWTDLVSIASLKGDVGESVDLRNNGTHIQWKPTNTDTWINIIALADIKGEKGDDGIDGVSAPVYSGTTIAEISSLIGEQEIFVGANLAFVPGNRIRFTALGQSYYVEGRVVSYDGQWMIVDVLFYTADPSATSDWSFTLVGEPGADGVDGNDANVTNAAVSGTFTTTVSDVADADSFAVKSGAETKLFSWANMFSKLGGLFIKLTGGQTIQSSGAGVIGLTVKGAAGQTGNLQEYHNSAGSVLAFTRNDGSLKLPYLTIGNGTAFSNVIGANDLAIGYSGTWSSMTYGLNATTAHTFNGILNSRSGRNAFAAIQSTETAHKVSMGINIGNTISGTAFRSIGSFGVIDASSGQTNYTVYFRNAYNGEMRFQINGATDVLNLTNTRAYVAPNTASTNTSTGALVVVGGVGIGGALNVGGIVSATATGQCASFGPVALTTTYVNINNGRGMFGMFSNGLDDRIVFQGDTARPLTFNTGSTTFGDNERMRISVNGNVLVGTTSDSGHKLNVGGGVNIGQNVLNFTYLAGPTAPTLALAGIAGVVPIRTNYYAVTYVTALGESSRSAAATIAVVSSADAQVDITLPIGDSTVTGRRIWRGGDGTNMQPLATIANNSTTTYRDNIAALGNTESYIGNTTSGIIQANGAKVLQVDSLGEIRLNGSLSGIRVPVTSSYPFVAYNTADEKENVEFGAMCWTANKFEVGAFARGGGAARKVCLISSNVSIRLAFELERGGTDWASITDSGTSVTSSFIRYNPTNWTNSAGTSKLLTLGTASMNQTGTGGFSIFNIDIVDNAVGSGARYLANWTVGGASKFSVTSAGLLSCSSLNVSGNTTIAAFAETSTTATTTGVGTACTLSITSGTSLDVTLTASTACVVTMPPATEGTSFTLFVKQPAVTGNGSATFTGVDWGDAGAPTITTAIGKMDIISFVAKGGKWFGTCAQGFTY